MNCRDWEERLALHAGGDLEPAGAAEVERHLAGCVGCRGFASELEQSLALMREVHDEAIAPADFAAVRARVLGQLERERNPWRQWAWVYAVAVAAVVLVVALWPREIPELPRVALYRPPAPAISRALPHRAATVRKRTRIQPPVEALMVKLITDDPNVVIYWIADADKGGEPK